MADTKPTFRNYVDITVTSWGSSLLTGEKGASASVDNDTFLDVELGVGGILESGTTPAAGGTMDVYAYAQYDEADSAAFTGGIDGLFTGVDEEEIDGTDLDLATLPLVVSVTAISVLGLRFGPIGITPLFSHALRVFGLVLHNNTSVTMTAGSAAGYGGMIWTSA